MASQPSSARQPRSLTYDVAEAAYRANLAAALDRYAELAGQREVLGQALADAVTYRDPDGHCLDCVEDPAGLCDDHAADLDLTEAYLALGREFGLEVSDR